MCCFTDHSEGQNSIEKKVGSLVKYNIVCHVHGVAHYVTLNVAHFKETISQTFVVVRRRVFLRSKSLCLNIAFAPNMGLVITLTSFS